MSKRVPAFRTSPATSVSVDKSTVTEQVFDLVRRLWRQVLSIALAASIWTCTDADSHARQPSASQGSTRPIAILISGSGDADLRSGEAVLTPLRTKLGVRTLGVIAASSAEFRRRFDAECNRLSKTPDNGRFILYLRGHLRKQLDDWVLSADDSATTPATGRIELSYLMQRVGEFADRTSVTVLLDVSGQIDARQFQQRLKDSAIAFRQDHGTAAAIVTVLHSGREASATTAIHPFTTGHLIGNALTQVQGSGPRIGRPAPVAVSQLLLSLEEQLQSFPQKDAIAIISSYEVPMEPGIAAEPPPAEAVVVDQLPRTWDILVRDHAASIRKELRDIGLIQYLVVPEFWDDEKQRPANTTFSRRLIATLVKELKDQGIPVTILSSSKLSSILQGRDAAAEFQVNPSQRNLELAETLIADEQNVSREAVAFLQGRFRCPGVSDADAAGFSVAEFSLSLQLMTSTNVNAHITGRAVLQPTQRIEADGVSFSRDLPAVPTNAVLPMAPKPFSSGDLVDPMAVSVIEGQIQELNDAIQQKSNPLFDPACPFSIRLRLKGRPQPLPIEHGEDDKAVSRLKPGDIYEIEILSEADRPLFLRLFVDGLNTLPRHTKTDSGATWETAPAVSPEHAAYWRIPPRSRSVFSGFVTALNGEGRHNLREFRITSAANSEGQAKQLDLSDIGVITAHFYTCVAVEDQQSLSTAGRGPLGTALGNQINEQLKYYRGSEIPSAQPVTSLNLYYEQ